KAYRFPEYETPVYAGQQCVVVGGGNVAMDAARTAKRLGADVTIVYRRSRNEMPARDEEIRHAEEEGIKLCPLTNPVRLIGDDEGWISQVEVVRMELGEPDASGRRSPHPIEGSNYTIDCDMFVTSIGNRTNPLIGKTTPGLETTSRNLIVIDEETGATSVPGVFAGGDAVSGAATVILAMGAGKRAAAGIAAYLSPEPHSISEAEAEAAAERFAEQGAHLSEEAMQSTLVMGIDEDTREAEREDEKIIKALLAYGIDPATAAKVAAEVLKEEAK
ncbi:MAG: FAD-dependent oxidoreductase, partial [Eggerthellaceae bacterium]|nr:FAD-dependent oxidoreductase [Eggerthellaceae bacterium]